MERSSYIYILISGRQIVDQCYYIHITERTLMSKTYNKGDKPGGHPLPFQCVVLDAPETIKNPFDNASSLSSKNSSGCT